jgi:hypothetical protein
MNIIQLVGGHYKLDGPYLEYACEILKKKGLYEILFIYLQLNMIIKKYDHTNR